MDSLAACLRCLPQSNHAAKFLFIIMESFSCCWAYGEAVNSAQPAVYFQPGLDEAYALSQFCIVIELPRGLARGFRREPNSLLMGHDQTEH